MKEIIIGSEDFCQFASIQAGIDYLAELPEPVEKKLTILAGTYYETITSYLSNVIICGLGDVKIIGHYGAREILPDGSERGTFRTATFFIEGENILLENLSIENQAGPGELVGQAIALFNCGHQTTVRNCRLVGYQDTLCTGPLPDYQKDGTPFLSPIKKLKDYCFQKYEHCFISGTIDFIFGGAQAIFESCQLHSLDKDGAGFITAASTSKTQAEGYLFENCYLSAESQAKKVFLGRPWRPYAKTTFKHSYFGSHIAAEGWDNWGNPKNEQSVRYHEIDNYGAQGKRPSWIRRNEEK
ncbi:pectin esterase [Enterococcus sp. JM4C]|uniref:pectinesterase family protein n=1 Tax=Candidatus Enterococcus huntleyi TaxID=1857217 RepID=UPI00137B3945|nr:pectinesterase family protein [Enterococcus sp. JM4C]KAF1299168.1 pectin esterase [Enterococcus sp. JM4C]